MLLGDITRLKLKFAKPSTSFYTGLFLLINHGILMACHSGIAQSDLFLFISTPEYHFPLAKIWPRMYSYIKL